MPLGLPSWARSYTHEHDPEHTRQLVVQEAETVWQALRLFERGKADFADCLVERSAAAAGCERTMTFDRDAGKIGMTLVG